MGWISKRRPKERRTVGRGKRSATLLRLANPERVRLHQPPRPTQVFRLWKARPWSPGMPSSTEGLIPSHPTERKRGRSSWLNWAWKGGIHISCRVSQKASTLGYRGSETLTFPLITHRLYPSKMYIIRLSIVSLRQAATSVRSHKRNSSGRWALSNHRRCPLFQKNRVRAPTEQYITFLTPTTLPQTLHPSILTSMETTSLAPGAPFRRLPYSSRDYLPAPKPPSVTSRTHTGRFQYYLPSGRGSSSACKRRASLQSTSAITLASRREVERMECWLTPGRKSSEDMGWAPSQSGSMITFSFEYHERICLATMPHALTGTARSKRTEAAGRKVGGSGSGEKAHTTDGQKSLMRTAA